MSSTATATHKSMAAIMVAIVAFAGVFAVLSVSDVDADASDVSLDAVVKLEEGKTTSNAAIGNNLTIEGDKISGTVRKVSTESEVYKWFGDKDIYYYYIITINAGVGKHVSFLSGDKLKSDTADADGKVDIILGVKDSRISAGKAVYDFKYAITSYTPSVPNDSDVSEVNYFASLSSKTLSMDLTIDNRDSYTLTWAAEGFTLPATAVKFEKPGTIKVPGALAKAYHVFKGWAVDGKLIMEYDPINSTVEKPIYVLKVAGYEGIKDNSAKVQAYLTSLNVDTTLTAVFEADDVVVSLAKAVKKVAVDDEGVESVTYDVIPYGAPLRTVYGQTIPAPALPDGFKAWVDVNGNTVDFTKPINGDVTFYAIEADPEPVIENVTIMFLDFNGKIISDMTIEVEKGKKIAQPVDLEREGYIFDGWYVNGAKVDFTRYVFDEDTTLTANFVKVAEPGFLETGTGKAVLAIAILAVVFVLYCLYQDKYGCYTMIKSKIPFERKEKKEDEE